MPGPAPLDQGHPASVEVSSSREGARKRERGEPAEPESSIHQRLRMRVLSGSRQHEDPTRPAGPRSRAEFVLRTSGHPRMERWARPSIPISRPRMEPNQQASAVSPSRVTPSGAIAA